LIDVALDSSAILAFVFQEKGADVAAPRLAGGLLSTVNLAEVHARMITGAISTERAFSWIRTLGCEICPFTETQARIAAELRPLTRHYGLSLGDRACLALGIERKATVYTTDRTWAQLDLGIQIEIIR
jgi:ribonuclease VapC